MASLARQCRGGVGRAPAELMMRVFHRQCLGPGSVVTRGLQLRSAELADTLLGIALPAAGYLG